MTIDTQLNSEELKARIRITKEGLYVFRDSPEKNKWEILLVEAEESRIEGDLLYSQKLLEHVSDVIDAMWTRIIRWQSLQFTLTRWFIGFILIELVFVAMFFYNLGALDYGYFAAMLFGLIGGTISVALSLGDTLDVAGSNRLRIVRLVFRPLVGIISSIVAFALFQTGVLSVSENVDKTSVLVLIGISAGYSERFLTRALSEYSSKLLGGK